MSEELIKRLHLAANGASFDGRAGDAFLMREAAHVLSRPAQAVQVPEGGPLRKLGKRLAELLDEDQFAECEALLLAASTPATAATEAVAQGGGVDVEKVMALVEEYFNVGRAYGRDGRGHDDEGGTALRLHAEIRALLASAPAVPVGDGWIAVGDRLPLEPDASVPYRTADVLATDGREVHQMQFCGGHIGGPGAWVCWESYGDFIPSQITHWQPLPPAPAATKKEN